MPRSNGTVAGPHGHGPSTAKGVFTAVENPQVVRSASEPDVGATMGILLGPPQPSPDTLHGCFQVGQEPDIFQSPHSFWMTERSTWNYGPLLRTARKMGGDNSPDSDGTQRA